MDPNKLDELRNLVEFLKENKIAEFDIERSDLKMRIKFAGEGGGPGIDLEQLGRLMGPSKGGDGGNVPSAATDAGGDGGAESAEKLHEVRSPIVGTFYDSPSPGSPTFVKLGDVVEVGQVLCIVEAMKLMNEIESDVAGEIVSRIASSGQPVEYGQPLFGIRAR